MDALFDLAALALAALVVADVVAPHWFHGSGEEGAAAPLRDEATWPQHLFLELALLGSLLLCLIFGPQLSQTTLGRALAGFVSVFWSLGLFVHLRRPRPGADSRAKLVRWALAATLAFLALVFALAALVPQPGPPPGPGVAPLPPPSAPIQPTTPTQPPPPDTAALHPAALHVADGHTHGGLFPGAHDHDHDGDLAPDQVPIVRYEPATATGPHGGSLAAISTAEEPDVGFAEVLWRPGKGRLTVWLARDRDFERPLPLAPDARVQVCFLTAQARSMGLRGPKPGSGRGPYTAGGALGEEESTRWLESLSPGTLARVLIEAGDVVYVSDDLELGPKGR